MLILTEFGGHGQLRGGKGRCTSATGELVAWKTRKVWQTRASGPEYQKISDNIFSAFIKAKRVIQVHPPVKI